MAKSLETHGHWLATEIGRDAPEIVAADCTADEDFQPDMTQPRYLKWLEV